MSTINISSLLRIFVEDKLFLENWTQLANSLLIPTVEVHSLKTGLNSRSITYHELVHSILSIWKSCNGNGATVDCLCDALQELKFTDIKGIFAK